MFFFFFFVHPIKNSPLTGEIKENVFFFFLPLGPGIDFLVSLFVVFGSLSAERRRVIHLVCIHTHSKRIAQSAPELNCAAGGSVSFTIGQVFDGNCLFVFDSPPALSREQHDVICFFLLPHDNYLEFIETLVSAPRHYRVQRTEGEPKTALSSLTIVASQTNQ